MEDQKKDGHLKNDEQSKDELGVAMEESEKCKKERDEYLNGWKRAKADLINYQKEESRRFEEMIKYGNEALIKDLVTVIDSFDLGIAAAEKNGNADKGIYIIRNQLGDILRKYGLEKIKVSTGEVFNPMFHESVGEVESGEFSSGAVAEEIEAGYSLNGKVVRPVRVKLVK